MRYTTFAATLVATTLLATPVLAEPPVAPTGHAGHHAPAPAAKADHARGTALGIDPAAMDRTVRPGDDFYAYANGTWMKTAEIPADRSGIGGSHAPSPTGATGW